MKFRAPVALSLCALAGCSALPHAGTTVAGTPAASRLIAPASPLLRVGNPAVDGITLSAERSLPDGAAAVPSLSTLVGLIAAAGMTRTLAEPGPFTLFAPTNAAFARLAPGTVATLLKPENHAALVRFVGLHVVPVRIDGLRLAAMAAGSGATLTTLAGEQIRVTMTGNIVTLTDAGGNRSYVETADIRQINGVMHVVNGVLVPRL